VGKESCALPTLLSKEKKKVKRQSSSYGKSRKLCCISSSRKKKREGEKGNDTFLLCYGQKTQKELNTEGRPPLKKRKSRFIFGASLEKKQERSDHRKWGEEARPLLGREREEEKGFLVPGRGGEKGTKQLRKRTRKDSFLFFLVWGGGGEEKLLTAPVLSV